MLKSWGVFCSPSGWRLPLLVFNRKHHSHYTVLPPSNLRRPFAGGSRQYIHHWNTESCTLSLFKMVLLLSYIAFHRVISWDCWKPNWDWELTKLLAGNWDWDPPIRTLLIKYFLGYEFYLTSIFLGLSILQVLFTTLKYFFRVFFFLQIPVDFTCDLG